MKLRAKVNTHIRHPKPFLRRRRQTQQNQLLVERVVRNTTIQTHLETPRVRFVSKHYVGGANDRIDQWQLQTRTHALGLSRAADGWDDTPFVLYTKGRLIVGKFALHLDRN